MYLMCRHCMVLHAQTRGINSGVNLHSGLSGAVLSSRLCVGGTEPQAPSVSIAHVKLHVGCDEPPTIPTQSLGKAKL